jgi:hypothetical protein
VVAEEKSALAPLLAVPRLAAWSFGGRIGTGCLDHAPLDQSEREFRGERQLSRAWCSTIRVAMPSRTGEASRVASSTPTWRLGVPCEGSVRDPIRLAALAPANHVARPGDMGMEAGALVRPTADGSVQRRRREEEQRESIPWLRVTGAETAGSSRELARRFDWGGGTMRDSRRDIRPMDGHAKLRVWQDARQLVVEVCACTRDLPADERYVTGPQLRRAVWSVSNNIAEGNARRAGRSWCNS